MIEISGESRTPGSKEGPQQGPSFDGWAAEDSGHPTETSFKPRLAHGVTLPGEFQGSGARESGYLLRRADGTMFLLSTIPFTLAEEIDGEKNLDDLAEALTRRLGRHVHADGVAYLIEHKLLPIGAVSDQSVDRRVPTPVLDLAARAGVIPPAVVRWIARRLDFLFRPPIVATVLLGAASVLTGILLGPGFGTGSEQLLSRPASLLMVVSLTLLSALFHEFGHASASSYGGAEPGVIGVGIYVVWPVLYTDTTEAYRLSRGSRIRTDLGGIYFNLILTCVFGLAQMFTGQAVWGAAALIQIMLILYQFLPFIRLDGYYLMTDLTGVPDLFAHMRPALMSMAPRAAASQRVLDLKPGVRLIVTAWALSAALALGWFLTRLAFGVPKFLHTATDQGTALWGRMSAALLGGDLLDGAATFLVLTLMAIQVLGLLILSGRILRSGCRALTFHR